MNIKDLPSLTATAFDGTNDWTVILIVAGVVLALICLAATLLKFTGRLRGIAFMATLPGIVLGSGLGAIGLVQLDLAQDVRHAQALAVHIKDSYGIDVTLDPAMFLVRNPLNTPTLVTGTDVHTGQQLQYAVTVNPDGTITIAKSPWTPLTPARGANQ